MFEFKSDLSCGVWFRCIDVDALSNEVRVSILDYLRGRVGFTKLCEYLGIARSSLHRYLSGERKIPREVIEKALALLSREEFDRIVVGIDKLRALGIIKNSGSIDYSTALQIIALASRDEYLKQAILKFVVEHFREDLRKIDVTACVYSPWDPVTVNYGMYDAPFVDPLVMIRDVTSASSPTWTWMGWCWRRG